jgi:hypothetical protein
MCQTDQDDSFSIAKSEIKEFGNFDRNKPLEVKYFPILTKGHKK